MPDIRSFFGGKKAGEGAAASQEKAKDAAPSVKPKGRGKRKVLSDSDDDDAEMQPAKKTTPMKPIMKKQMCILAETLSSMSEDRILTRFYREKKSPVGEVTTTSDYFASSGKSKPTRSTPTKPKASAAKDKVGISSESANTPQTNRVMPVPEPASGKRTSSRKKSKPNYGASDNEGKENADTESGLGPKVIREDDDSGEDIFGAAYSSRKNGIKDDYESDEEDEIVQPIRTATRNRKGATSKKKYKAMDDNSDLEMMGIEPEKPKSVKSFKEQKTPRGRKRKSIDFEEDENDENTFTPLKKPTTTNANSSGKRSTTKKVKASASKDSTPVRTAVDDIFDTIPMVRPPTPPPPSDSKKFNFHANTAARGQPPPAAGSKELPVGAENCLAGLTFVFTGILDALGREEGQELVKRHGGKVTTTPSGKTSYVVLGNDAGPKKLETIAKHKLKTINEDGLFALIRRLPAHDGDSKSAEQYKELQRKEEKKIEDQAEEMAEQERKDVKERAKSAPVKPGAQSNSQHGSTSAPIDADSRLWTVKYAPTATAMICGNKGQVEKLQAWLRAWPSNARTQFKKAGKDGHGVYRAMMLHGPPGIGKTTAAHLAAKLEGYDIVESNASDTRSKKLVETGLRGVLDTTSLLGFFAGDGKKVDSDKKKLVLIMDEVDGMSAGDRGGVGALAAVCKKTSIPMILICNDRKLPKMRPFDNVTYDLPFRRPTVDQIRSRIMTICYREKLKIPAPVINALIEGSHSDIRQVINMLSTAKLDQEAMDFDQGKQMSKSWEKHVILKPWDIVSKILGGGMFASSSKATLNDKIELYFNDHEFSSLMLQENYLGTNPIMSHAYSGKEKNLKLLELTDKAAESISDGDLVDRMIHGSQQQWSLMPTHAVFSFVRPASFVSGSQAGSQTRFTSWLGNNSKQGKLMRFVKEIQGHMRLRASGDRHEIRQQYLPILWYKLVKELQVEGKEGIDDIIELMDSYFLTKDDWDAILELGVGPMDEKSVSIPTQTKTAFTRNYNVRSHPLPFMKAGSVAAPKAKRDKPDLEEALDDLDEGEEIMDEDAEEGTDEDDKPLDLKKDKYVKAPKKKPKSTSKKALAKENGKGKVKDESEVDIDNENSGEDFKRAKGKASTKGKVRARK